jgi:hypothetical protein
MNKPIDELIREAIIQARAEKCAAEFCLNHAKFMKRLRRIRRRYVRPRLANGAGRGRLIGGYGLMNFAGSGKIQGLR